MFGALIDLYQQLSDLTKRVENLEKPTIPFSSSESTTVFRGPVVRTEVGQTEPKEPGIVFRTEGKPNANTFCLCHDRLRNRYFIGQLSMLGAYWITPDNARIPMYEVGGWIELYEGNEGKW